MIDKDINTIGAAFKRACLLAMNEEGINMRELAKEFEVSPAAVSLFLDNDSLNSRNLERYAKRFNIEVTFKIKGIHDKPGIVV